MVLLRFICPIELVKEYHETDLEIGASVKPSCCTCNMVLLTIKELLNTVDPDMGVKDWPSPTRKLRTLLVKEPPPDPVSLLLTEAEKVVKELVGR